MPSAMKERRKKKKLTPLSSGSISKHELYQASVQNVEAEIDFVDETYKTLRGRHATLLREDFCGTGHTSCEWVRRRRSNRAFGLDIDAATLDWGRRHELAKLTADEQERVRLLKRDVLSPGDAVGMDCILAMNFSYWLFMDRPSMVRYFQTVRESLAEGGIFFQDFYGGSETMEEREDERECELPDGRGFTYIWDQHKYTPVTGAMHCKIHFAFEDGSVMRDAFEYHWRLWTLVELQELLAEAGFSKTTIYWEGDELDEDGEPTGEGNGIFTPTTTGEADPAYICYIVSEK